MLFDHEVECNHLTSNLKKKVYAKAYVSPSLSKSSILNENLSEIGVQSQLSERIASAILSGVVFDDVGYSGRSLAYTLPETEAALSRAAKTLVANSFNLKRRHLARLIGIASGLHRLQ